MYKLISLIVALVALLTPSVPAPATIRFKPNTDLTQVITALDKAGVSTEQRDSFWSTDIPYGKPYAPNGARPGEVWSTMFFYTGTAAEANAFRVGDKGDLQETNVAVADLHSLTSDQHAKLSANPAVSAIDQPQPRLSPAFFLLCKAIGSLPGASCKPKL